MTVTASDQALPTDRTSTTQVIITVPRDTDPPTFERPEYTAEIGEDAIVGTAVLDLQARDNNLEVCVLCWDSDLDCAK